MTAVLFRDEGRADAQPVMRQHDLRLVPAAGTVWGAAMLGLLWEWWAAVVLAALSMVVAAVTARRYGKRGGAHRAGGSGGARGLAGAGALLVSGLLAAGPVAVRLHTAEHDPMREAARSGGDAVVRAVVAERPKPLRTPGYAGRPGGARSVLLPVDVVHATVRERPVRSEARVLLIAPFERWSRLLPGQAVTARGALAPARPGELTTAVVSVRGPPAAVGAPPWWQRQAELTRSALRAACQVLGAEPAGLLPGLVVGDTSALPSRVEDEFLDAGMSHLTAVSGSNVAIVVGAVLLLARALRAGPRLSAAVAALVLAGFMVLVGYEASVLRAGVMGAVALLALILGRNRSAVPALSTAVCVLVVLDPAMAVNLGFALSVVATGGLVLLAPRWADAMARRRVPRGVAEGLAVPVVAFLVTAPVLAGMVGEVSMVSVVANLLASPVVAPVTVLGALAAALARGWSDGAELLVQLAGPGARWLILVAREAAAVPGAVLSWPSGWWGGLAAAALVGLVVLALRFRRLRMALAVGLVVLLLVVVPVRVVAPSWPPPDWAVVACDVGQGDGLVLATGEPGRAVVVDTGPEPGAMDRCLDRLDVDRVPLVVLTHLHADHVGGLPAVFDGRAVGAVGVGPGRVPAWAWREVAAEADGHAVPVVGVGAGDRLRWPRLRLEVLGPRYVAPASSEEDGTAINDVSVVLAATTPAGRVLLTGDVELAAQSDLLASGADLRADVLKVPHHGSRYAVPEFFDAVAPRVALVSVGEENTYGHPSDETLRELSADGVLVARTDTGGDVAVVPHDDGPAVVRRDG